MSGSLHAFSLIKIKFQLWFWCLLFRPTFNFDKTSLFYSPLRILVWSLVSFLLFSFLFDFFLICLPFISGSKPLIKKIYVPIFFQIEFLDMFHVWFYSLRSLALSAWYKYKMYCNMTFQNHYPKDFILVFEKLT